MIKMKKEGKIMKLMRDILLNSIKKGVNVVKKIISRKVFRCLNRNTFFIIKMIMNKIKDVKNLKITKLNYRSLYRNVVTCILLLFIIVCAINFFKNIENGYSIIKEMVDVINTFNDLL